MTPAEWVYLRMWEMEKEFMEQNPGVSTENQIFMPLDFWESDFLERLQNSPETLFKYPDTYQRFIEYKKKGGNICVTK